MGYRSFRTASASSLGFHRLPVRLLIRLIVAVSTLSGFCAFYNMYSYMPWLFGTLKALEMTALVHFGLWLATLEVQSRWRFLVAAMLFPSIGGAYLLLWHYGLVTLLAAAAGMIWLLLKVVQGQRLDF